MIAAQSSQPSPATAPIALASARSSARSCLSTGLPQCGQAIGPGHSIGAVWIERARALTGADRWLPAKLGIGDGENLFDFDELGLAINAVEFADRVLE